MLDIIRKLIDLKLYLPNGKKKISPKLRKNIEIVDEIIECTNFLDVNTDIIDRIYCLINNITSQPVCKICGNPTRFHKSNNKFSEYCSLICSANDDDKKDKTKQTNIEKYGAEYPIQNILFKEKIKTTCIEKYGVSNVSKLPNIRLKAESTCIEKYGTDFQNIQKIKRKQTMFNKYGVYSALQSKDIMDKMKYDNNIKYGTEYISRIDIVSLLPKLSDKEFLYNEHIVNKKPIYIIAKELGMDNTTLLRYIHKHNIPVQRFSQSYGEIEIAQFLTNNNIIFTQNDRSIISPQELDFYLPEYNIAIEFDGLYWHSEQNGKDKQYHINKTNKCEGVGIKLIHIFENEWNSKGDIVKSRILNMCGKSAIKIMARKCSIISISSRDSKAFLDANHIQGSSNSPINLGLVYNNELVALMTFGKSRFNKKYEYELIRYCNKINHNVTGGAGKLLAYFRDVYSPKSIISYSDKRWSTGNLYKTLGFKYLHTSAPNYWYFKNEDIIESRIKYQKHKLINILKSYDNNLSEAENMELNDFFRIYDCGNDVWVV